MFELTENLAAGTGGYSVADGIKGWTDELSSYNPQSPTYSHFTQVVWKGTEQLGCASFTCAPGKIFDIQYKVRPFRLLSFVDLNCGCRTGSRYIHRMRVLPSRQCYRSIRVRLLFPFYPRVQTYAVFSFFAFFQRERSSLRPISQAAGGPPSTQRFTLYLCTFMQVNGFLLARLSSSLDGRR